MILVGISISFSSPIFIFISLILRKEYIFFPQNIFLPGRITVFRDEKKAICWKYEERFLIKVNKLWRIALTDTLKVLSLEEQEREFSSRS